MSEQPGENTAVNAATGGPTKQSRIVPQHDQLLVVASDTLDLSGDVQRLVTFLNRSLKDEGFIFGLRLADDGRVRLTIYQG